jgi:hypothetical protein
LLGGIEGDKEHQGNNGNELKQLNESFSVFDPSISMTLESKLRVKSA